MMSTNYDLIVLGSGPAASKVAKDAAEDGKRVAVIEAREFGGTCALRGCNPKKVYTNAGQLADQVRRADGKLISCPEIQIQWRQLLEFKQTFTDPVLEKSEPSFASKGIVTLHGRPRFVNRNTLEVAGQRLRGERIFIGVGARPVPLGIEGETHVIHSDDFLELETLPQHVTFIGAGYISMEFAHVAARYGSRVVVIERGDRPLEQFDPDLVDQLSRWSAANGIKIITNSEVASVERSSDGFSVEYQRDGDSNRVSTGLVVHGAGRVPNLDGLDLEAAQIQYDKKGIEVNQYMQSTSNPVVFAGGDCAATGKPRLTPTANEHARVASKNLFSATPEATPDYGSIPAVVFTSPPLASVGLSETDVRKSEIKFELRHEDTSQWGSVRKTAVECAAYKVLINKANDQILGAHLLGPSADETINLFALAIKFGLTATDLKSTLFAFPTFASDVRKMV